MPILVSGGNSNTASQRELAVFSLCALVDKRDQSKKQLHLISFSLFCCIMSGWTMKISLTCAIGLLMIAICFMLLSLYNESKVLRQVQRELIGLLRETPQEDIEQFFAGAVADLHED